MLLPRPQSAVVSTYQNPLLKSFKTSFLLWHWGSNLRSHMAGECSLTGSHMRQPSESVFNRGLGRQNALKSLFNPTSFCPHFVTLSLQASGLCKNVLRRWKFPEMGNTDPVCSQQRAGTWQASAPCTPSSQAPRLPPWHGPCQGTGC